jgi:uncharacterized flavoprotein (TIGR03862 family)
MQAGMSRSPAPPVLSVAVIGAGPAGLMAAEVLSAGGAAVAVYDRMPSPARKFLMAGRGGLNLTHSEDFERFVTRYGAAANMLRPALETFPPQALRDWADGLGAETFVGSSGRIFPKAMKASPLLRTWLRRLEAQGVTFNLRHDWRGWDGEDLLFEGPSGAVRVRPDAVVLALGGASWPRLGGDGGWGPVLAAKGVTVVPLRPANMGFSANWSEGFAARFAGQPLKNIALSFGGRTVRGEIMLTSGGIEGGAVYALSAALREAIEQQGFADLSIDLRPDLSAEAVAAKLAKSAAKDSFSNRLRKTLGLSPAAIGLVREVGSPSPGPAGPPLPLKEGERGIKTLTVRLTGTQGLERAISTAGGVAFDGVTADFELKALPGVYAIGEMLDWEAPTGGYLLQACFSTAVAVAHALLAKRVTPA